MLEEIKKDIARLISLYEAERQRANSLAEQLSRSESAIASYKEQITGLEHQIDNMKLSNAFTAGGDTREARERLDKLIREIDKCIAMLEQ